MLFGMLMHPFYIAFVDGSLIMLSFIIKLDMVPTYVNVTSTCPSGYPRLFLVVEYFMVLRYVGESYLNPPSLFN
jgi:hypothetical protein